MQNKTNMSLLTWLRIWIAVARYHLKSRFVSAANEESEIAIANALSGGETFQLQQGDRFFIPYGDYPHKLGMQKFDRASAEIMASLHNDSRPVYKGHPDVPGRPDSDPSAPAWGWVDRIEPTATGANFYRRMNETGERAIANAEFRYYSPYWDLRRVKGGLQPVRLRSMGLTNNPRIPVPPIANDDNPETMKLSPKIAKLLGLAEDGDHTDETVSAACDALITKMSGHETAANDAQTRLTTAQTELTTVKGQLSAANDALKSARTARIDLALSGLVAASKLTGAERDTARAELLAIENDDQIGTRLEELGKVDPKLKKKPVTEGLGDEKSKLKQAENDAAVRAEKIRTAVDDELQSISNDIMPSKRYDMAFSRARTKHPELFQAQA
jgi:hypothetical protein